MVNLPVSKLLIPPGTKVRASLLRSIQEKGVLAPILVQSNGTGYKILDGRRRAAAAIQAGLNEVPAILIEDGGPEVTLLTHGTRSENPVAELEAIQELQRRGLSEKEIARAGYSSLPRIRRLAKLNRLTAGIAEKVEAGEIAPSVAFEIACLPHEEQRLLLANSDRITSATVRQAKFAHRQTAVQVLTEQLEPLNPISVEELFSHLSQDTLSQILRELPGEPRIEVWRTKIRRLLEEPGIQEE
jgi:ParB family chromosome partitioning protein